MTASVSPPRVRAVGRVLLLVAAIALTTCGVCLVAFSDSTRTTRLGIPIAFWGVLLGYAAIRMGPGPNVMAPAWGASALDPARSGSGELEVRAAAELVRERDDAARREYELRLELMLRGELEQVLREELSGLRRDVAELRGDVLDAVDGRLRMERVEITRIIGSNIAALQDADSRTVAGASGGSPALTATGWADSADVPTPARPAEVTIPELVAPEAVQSEADVGVAPEAVSPEAVAPEAVAPEAVAPEGVTPEETQSAPGEPAPAAVTAKSGAAHRASEPAAAAVPVARAQNESSSGDPFAALPRLSSFRLPELPPEARIEAARDRVPEPVGAVTVAAAVPAAAAGAPSRAAYVGRRRQGTGTASDDADATGAAPGAHSVAGRPSSARSVAGAGSSNRTVAHHRG